MGHRLRTHLSYANIASTLAIVLALGGVSYAAANLPRNSVGTPQLKNGAVTAPKLKASAVTPSKLAPATRTLIERPQGTSVLSGGLVDLLSVGPSDTLSFRTAVSDWTEWTDPPATHQGLTLSPARPMRAGAMTVRLLEDLPATSSAQVALFVKSAPGEPEAEADSVLECTVVGTAGTDDRTCSTSGPGLVPAGSVIYIRVRLTGGVATAEPGAVFWGLTMEPV